MEDEDEPFDFANPRRISKSFRERVAVNLQLRDLEQVHRKLFLNIFLISLCSPYRWHS